MKQPTSEKLRQRQLELVAGLHGTKTVTTVRGGGLGTLPFQPPVTEFKTSRPVPIKSASDLGLVVQYLRQERNVRQQQLADLAGVGRRFLSELENGKETLEFDKALKVAAALGIELIVRQG